MDSDASSAKVPKSLEGLVLAPSTDEEFREAIAQACDYRGDVTIELKTGKRIIGYVFDRQGEGMQAFLKIFLAGQDQAEHVQVNDIQRVVFSGEDTAFGRSWEDWAKKWKKADPEP